MYDGHFQNIAAFLQAAAQGRALAAAAEQNQAELSTILQQLQKDHRLDIPLSSIHTPGCSGLAHATFRKPIPQNALIVKSLQKKEP